MNKLKKYEKRKGITDTITKGFVNRSTVMCAFSGKTGQITTAIYYY